MTRDEIFTLNGPQLAVLVAEHIFGMVWWQRGPGGGYIALEPDDDFIPDYWTRETLPSLTREELTVNIPNWTDDATLIRDVETAIAEQGLVEPYVLALIDVLGLDMQPFNSAIELDWWFAPPVEGNRFEWDGNAYLWLFLRATPEERCKAALLAKFKSSGNLKGAE